MATTVAEMSTQDTRQPEADVGLVDRIVAGHVVDFMIVGYGPLRTGVFNVADVALMLGAAIFAAAEVQDWISRRTRYDRPA